MPTLDFVENVAIWTFAGLLAISGTPAAAIAFLTVAPSFVVAMRSGSLGAIITWYVDGDVAAVVDTHSDTEGIIRRTLVGDPANETHQIYAVKDDDPDTIAEIVRKELSEDEARPVGTRYNEDCSCVQSLVDGVWVDNPQADPRTSPAYQYPPPATSDPACDAAERIVAAVGRILTTMTTAAGIIEAVNAIIAVIAVFFPPVALFIALLFALVNAANAIGFAAVALAFDDATYETLKCLIRGDIGADGQFDATEWDTFQADVGTTFGISTVTAVLSLMFNGIGLVGFNNMAAVGTETGDCSMCEWEHTWDFTINDNGYTAISSGGVVLGNYVLGLGWEAVASSTGNTSLAINALDVPPTNYISVTWRYTSSDAVDGLGYATFVYFDSGASGTQEVTLIEAHGGLTGVRIDAYVLGTTTASLVLTSTTVRGIGVNPFI